MLRRLEGYQSSSSQWAMSQVALRAEGARPGQPDVAEAVAGGDEVFDAVVAVVDDHQLASLVVLPLEEADRRACELAAVARGHDAGDQWRLRHLDDRRS
jgi:hypothetical protein